MTSEIRLCTTYIKSLNIPHTFRGFFPVTPLQVLSLLVTIFAKMTALLYFSKQTSKKPQHTAVTGNYYHIRWTCRANSGMLELQSHEGFLSQASYTHVSRGPVRQFLSSWLSQVMLKSVTEFLSQAS